MSEEKVKVFALAPNENWICDRFCNEWNQFSNGEYTENIHEADIIWLLGAWAWRAVPLDYLSKKKVVATIHHITPSKFTKESLREFLSRDRYVDAYHVPCQQTSDFISKITNKDIYVIPFWVNQNIWAPTPEKDAAKNREKYNLPTEAFLVGSFQRDTEGSDLKSPKLEKGPDRFCNIVEKMHAENKNLEVVLAGWRRQYVIGRLKAAGIKYHYFELPEINVVSDLYNALDLYIVSARHEGGPQAIVECAATKTPIISTKVGIAASILDDSSLYEEEEYESAQPNISTAYKNVEKLFIPAGIQEFKKMFKEIK
tara:strand:- start:2373 stop:3311 length:939 start_codon:yes stop_codon:yes gene_type:complete